MTFRRVAAFLIDWLCIIAYAVVLVPFGVALTRAGIDLSPWVLNAGAFLILIVPATVWLAGWERGGRGATPGKRLLKLRVIGRRPDASLGWSRSLARSALKLALPWELGHTSGYAFASGADAAGIVCSLLAYGLLFVYLGFSFVGTGRTPYDLITDSRVVDTRNAPL
jgi:uncharacterized RDD family membrane protein YckC